MQFEFIHTLPPKCYVAASGGPDSMAVLHFLARNGKRNVDVLFYHHGTPASDNGLIALQEGVDKINKESRGPNEIEIHSGWYSGSDGPFLSEAEHRDNRYEFFSRFTDKPIVTGHNLDDCVESWIFYSLRGNSKTIPYSREMETGATIIRPFLLTRKYSMEHWCDKNDVPYAVDPTNLDRSNARSIIRHDIVPSALKVAPGLYSTIAKHVIGRADSDVQYTGDKYLYMTYIDDGGDAHGWSDPKRLTRTELVSEITELQSWASKQRRMLVKYMVRKLPHGKPETYAVRDF